MRSARNPQQRCDMIEQAAGVVKYRRRQGEDQSQAGVGGL